MKPTGIRRETKGVPVVSPYGRLASLQSSYNLKLRDTLFGVYH
ncbi:hypothetical protein BFO_2111 [Tannerella forsythia 92A2]|uniref:Uncharacterized protein n=1 Tax=Tannerella forsythia (strain ATCC 43037 / JCM 10827 / CCUG 21028 A / KCTC 5666 / FDC 338) TaxID=203275 RepID=G8UHY4_TANFA|nr:hypothetical protein BFO_2111 [Tannerella forsythia 92A2]